MGGMAYAVPVPSLGTQVPRVCSATTRRSLFGDAALVLFLLSQCLDGVFTYVGVATFGLGIEANPLIAAAMAQFGHGVALAAAKTVASVLGICLHLHEVHSAVALLTAFYLTAAVLPWTVILFVI